MATASKPERQATPAFDGNIELLLADAIPTQVRALQTEIVELERSIGLKRIALRRWLDAAVLHNVPLCAPAARENGNAAGPGGADGAAVRVVGA
jgi:hypothetical protein